MSLIRSAFGVCALLFCLACRADWRYSEEVDKMTGGREKWAQIESNNTLALQFPYAGPNYGRIYVRQHPRHGLDVFVSVDKGQILCPSYDGCSVMVRFDENKPITFKASGSSDRDPRFVFLRSESRFIADAKKAKSILVQLEMYRGGSQLLEFHSSSPLQWAAGAKKAK